MKQDRNHRSFILKLDGQCAWNLTSTGGTDQWLREFASILELKRGNAGGVPQIEFIRGTSTGPAASNPAWPPDLAALKSLAEDGWERNNLGLVRFWSPREGSNLVCELLNAPARKMAILMMGQALRPLYSEAVKSRGLVLHGALVALNGKGVVLAGANDAGKTTCCRRLPAPWNVLSDDETLLIHREGEGYFAHPLPTWSNHFRSRSAHSCDVRQRVSLAAVFFLEQAPCVEVSPMGRGRAAGKINESARQTSFCTSGGLGTRQKEIWTTALFETACHIAKTVPNYSLRLNLTGRFWEEIERLLRGA